MYVHGMDEVLEGSKAETRRFAVGLFQGEVTKSKAAAKPKAKPKTKPKT